MYQIPVAITKPNLLECVLAGAAVPLRSQTCSSAEWSALLYQPPLLAEIPRNRCGATAIRRTHVCMPSVASRRDYSANHPYRQQQLLLHTAAVPGGLTQNRRARAETRPAEEGKPENPGKKSQGARSRCRWIPKRKFLTLEEGGACCTGPAGHTLFYSFGRQTYQRNVPRSGVRSPCRIPHSSSAMYAYTVVALSALSFCHGWINISLLNRLLYMME